MVTCNEAKDHELTDFHASCICMDTDHSYICTEKINKKPSRVCVCVFSLFHGIFMTSEASRIVCIICLEDLNGPESEVVAISCGHVFDREW